MAIATKKSDEINALLSSLMGGDRVETIEADRCAAARNSRVDMGGARDATLLMGSCEGDGNAVAFDDELSRREYGISGLCQKCQDGVFGGGI